MINFINRLLTENEAITLWVVCEQKYKTNGIKSEESGKNKENSVYYNVKKCIHIVNLWRKKGGSRKESGQTRKKRKIHKFSKDYPCLVKRG